MQDYVGLAFGQAYGLPDRRAGRRPGLVRNGFASLVDRGGPGLIKGRSHFAANHLPIEPRKQWPLGGMPRYRTNGRIQPKSIWRSPARRCASGGVPAGAGWFDKERHRWSFCR